MITIEITCPFPHCEKTHSVNVPIEEYLLWANGAKAQDVLLSLSDTEREQLISGMCPSCQDDFFDSDEDEDECYDEPYDLDCGFDPYEDCYAFDC